MTNSNNNPKISPPFTPKTVNRTTTDDRDDENEESNHSYTDRYEEDRLYALTGDQSSSAWGLG